MGSEISSMYDDMMREILYRLSLKELSCFKAVSKEFNNLLSDDEFRRDRDNRRLRGDEVIFYDKYRQYQIYSGEIRSIIDSEKAWSCPSVNPPYPYDNWNDDNIDDELTSKPFVLGSYNGLIALKSYNSNFILWNPITQECKDYDIQLMGVKPDVVGFCHNISTDEYMAIIVSTQRINYVNYSITEIINFSNGSYELNNSTWEGVYCSQEGEVGTVVCGVPHWVVEFGIIRNEWEGRRVYYFDLQEEEFVELALPIQEEKEMRLLGIGALNGQRQLGVVFHDSNAFLASHEVWVMKEYEKPESWTILCKLPSLRINSCEQLNILGLMPTGQLLMRCTRDYKDGMQLITYDLTKLKLQYMEPQSSWYHEYRLDSYEPSLISPPAERKNINSRLSD